MDRISPQGQWRRRLPSLDSYGFEIPHFEFPSLSLPAFFSKIKLPRLPAPPQAKPKSTPQSKTVSVPLKATVPKIKAASVARVPGVLATLDRTFDHMADALPDDFSFLKKPPVIAAFLAAGIALVGWRSGAFDKVPAQEMYATPLHTRSFTQTVLPLIPIERQLLNTAIAPAVFPVVRLQTIVAPRIVPAPHRVLGVNEDANLSFDRCHETAQSIADDDQDESKLRDFVAAWTVTCMSADETQKLNVLRSTRNLGVADVSNTVEGRLLLTRERKLLAAENALVDAAPVDEKNSVRQAVRWVYDHGIENADQLIDKVADSAASAAEQNPRAARSQPPFSNVVFHPASGVRILSITTGDLIDIANVCQREADVLGEDGIQSCAAVIFNRMANGWFGSLRSILNAKDFEAIARFNGIENMPPPMQSSIQAVQRVIDGNMTYRDATFFFDEVVVAKRHTNAWSDYSMVGIIGERGIAWHNHRLDNGIVMNDTLHLFEVPSYTVVVNGQKQHRRPLVVAQNRPVPGPGFK